MLLYSQVIRADRMKSPVGCMTTNMHKFICDKLLLDPVTTNVLIQNLLCVWCPDFTHTDDQLQNIYTEALELCTLELENRSNRMSTKKSYESNSIVDPREIQNMENICRTLLCILSLLEVSEEKENTLIEHFFPRLLDLCESELISRQFVYLAIVCRKKLKLAKMLMSLEDDRYERAGTISDEVVLNRICSKLLDSVGNVQIEEMFLRLMKNEKHWIEDIVDICSHILVFSNIERVQKILAHHTLSKLWPVVLLYVWKYFSDKDDIFTILSVLLEQCKKVVTDPVVSALCYVVEHQILVVQWCKKHGQRFSLNNKDFLQLTREHSTLEVLRRTTSLEDLEWNEARDLLLLNTKPDFLNANEIRHKEGENKGISWEVTTFDGFCILKKALAVFQASMEVEQLIVNNPSLENEGGGSNSVEFETLYRERVTEQLQEMKTMLCQLFSLNFRVEILENIFSLLFLRYEDFQEESSSDSGAEDDEGDQEAQTQKSEIPSNVIDGEFSKGTKYISKTSHNMSSFQPSNDVSSLLRNMPVIEAQVSVSPPLDQSKSSPVKDSETFLNISVSPLKTQDLSPLSKKSDESPGNVFSKRATSEKCSHVSSSLSDTFNKFSKSHPGCLVTLSSHAQHSSVPSTYSITSHFVESTSVSADKISDISRSHLAKEIHQEQRTRERKKSIKSNNSENASSKSRGSKKTVKENRQGFVCNQCLVRDLLYLLKECIVETSAALYSSLSVDSVTSRKVEVLSSIESSSLQQCVNRLSLCVNEAAWRLQLFTDAEFTQKVGIVPAVEQILTVSNAQDDWIYQSEESESEDENEATFSASSNSLNSNRLQKQSLKRSKSEIEKSSESGSQSNKSSGGNIMPSGYHKTRWSKSQSRHTSYLPLPHGIINLMLSSQSSLAVRCLTHGELTKAKQVIRMIEIEDNTLAVEVKFIEAYQSLINKLKQCVESSQWESRESTNLLAPGRKTSTLENIKIVASAGIQSTSLTSQVETFLSITPIPGIQGAERIISDFPHETNMLQGVDNNTAMTALDLALTIGATYEHSASLLDVACKRCGILQTGVSSYETGASRNRTRSNFPGYIQFTVNIIKLLKEANKSHSSRSIFPSNISLFDLICSEYLPVSLRCMKDFIIFWNNFHEVSVEFQASLINADERRTPNTSLNRAATSKDGHALKSHIAFRRLLEICKDQPADGKISEDRINYLQQVYIYLKLVTSLLQQNFPADTAHCELANLEDYFDLFNSSLVVLLGRLVFECDVSPAYLEPIARKLRLNLVYNIVSNCCPKIPNAPASNVLHVGNELEKNWGKIILNNSVKWHGPVRHPEVAVRSLLGDVLHIIQEQSEHFMDRNNVLNRQQISALAENSVMKSVLIETCELSEINLELLVAGDETLVFYTNLANLMWIHSVLILETSYEAMGWSVLLERVKDSSFVDVTDSEMCWDKAFGIFSSSPLERQIARMSFGYNVGKLGFISLQEVHQKLLGEMTFPFEISLRSYSVMRTMPQENTSLSSTSIIDPRVLFVLQNGQKQSPRPQVLYVESVDTQLDKSMMEFLNCNVKLEEKRQELIIPELLHLYQDYVQLNQEPESHSAVPALTNARSPLHFALEEDDDQICSFYSRERLIQLLDFLHESTSGHLQSKLAMFSNIITGCQLDIAGSIVRIEKSINEFGLIVQFDRDVDHDANSDENDGTNDSKNNVPISNCHLVDDVWKHRVVQDPIVKFLESHCWLLSLLVQRIHQEKSLHASPVNETLSQNIIDGRIKCLEQLFRSEWVNALKPLYQNNLIVTALNSKPNIKEFWCILDKLMKKQDWKQCTRILWALPERELLNDPKLQTLHDIAMFEQASNLITEGNTSPWWFCQHIEDVCVQAQCLLKHLPHWPGHGCQDALKCVLGNHQQKLADESKSQLLEMLHKISIYEKILPFTDSASVKTWYDVKCASENNPGLIMDLLMEAKEFQICIEWAKQHKIATQAHHLIDSRFVLLILEYESSNFVAATKLLQSVPMQQAIAICNELIQQIRSIPFLKFITNFLLTSGISDLSSKQVDEYQSLSIGIQMMTVLPPLEQFQLWELVGQPQLIVEQFIMNTRLEMLEKMISEVHPLLIQLPVSSPMSLSSIDSMLRHYASKSLDFRVIQSPPSSRTVPSDEKLQVSMSTASTNSEEFVIPAAVPSKNEWIPNDQVRECMCCKSVAFSMFNRRHHCRRCGRVICGSCSTQRTKVVGYGNVAVRVCDDCHQHIANDAEQLLNPTTGERQPPFSLNSEGSVSPECIWRLTSDEGHNTTLREEFGFEHAPSVSLCLSILKLHSEHAAYPRFLLDACDRMLRLLQPVGPGIPNPEVDYSVLIRMVRSLIVAAKVKHARSGLNTGVAHCDQLLSQVDLLNMLVKSGCSALIPAEPLSGHALRRLRDRLVEEELWMLAMEVSTKSGLERIGVWAAWGKACLRAGCWDEAREKFSHCLEKVMMGPDSVRPQRNPPLLTEIIQILEEGAYTVDRKILQQANSIRATKGIPSTLLSSPALTILHTLSSLNEIADGNYPQATPPLNTVVIGPKLDPLFYRECCYYLSSYGSHAGIISFYLGHDDLPAALKHVLLHKVDPDIFIETIYLPCLRQGLVSNLHEELSTVDPTLERWKVYLCHVCHHFEKQGMLNVLYQLQLHMHDYIRAAMTCTIFYQKGARNYTDLAANIEHLYSAHRHLENELLTVQWETSARPSPARRIEGSLQLAKKLNPREVNCHINTILRQIEVTKFLHGCELGQRPVMELLPEIFHYMQSATMFGNKLPAFTVPTLFGSNSERVLLVVLAILCGTNVEEGFGLAFRIIEDYHLKSSQVYGLAGKKLARDCRLMDIEQLVSCIHNSGVTGISSVCDSVLLLCIQELALKTDPGDVEPLVKLLTDIGNKITAYIECRQLKSAYLLAVKYNRLEDVRRILHEAEKLGQTKIQQICQKRLGQSDT
ncbi:uncharacterized protein Sptz isoform X2 [Periplaneta americana]